MKLLIGTLALFACIYLSVQDTGLLSFGDRRQGVFFQKYTRKSPKYKVPTNFTLSFDINFGNRKFSAVDFTTPNNRTNNVILNWSGKTLSLNRVVQSFYVFNAKEFQIDATAYIYPWTHNYSNHIKFIASIIILFSSFNDLYAFTTWR